MATAVAPMQKISLTLVAGTEPGGSSFTPEPVPFEFVYGVGANGMTPFELAFQERSTGDRIRLVVKKEEAVAFFGRFLGPVTKAAKISLIPPTTCLDLTVDAIGKADDSEIVKALAGSLGEGGHGGCGGSCGCGC